jgi:hypothetical protein
VIKRSGLASYEKLAEEFGSKLGARTRTIPIEHIDRGFSQWVQRVHGDLVFAIGKTAYAAVRRRGLESLLHVYVYGRTSPQHLSVASRPSPLNALKLLKQAKPSIKRVGMLLSNRQPQLVKAAKAAAKTLGLNLRVLRARSPAHAISVLRQSSKLHALWLPADLSLLSRRVIRYAISLQFRRRVPLVVPSRRHVQWGALLAVDHAPAEIGKLAACRANALLMHTNARTGKRRRLHVRRILCPALKPRITINLIAARHLQLATHTLRKVAHEVIQ